MSAPCKKSKIADLAIWVCKELKIVLAVWECKESKIADACHPGYVGSRRLLMLAIWICKELQIANCCICHWDEFP